MRPGREARLIRKIALLRGLCLRMAHLHLDTKPSGRDRRNNRQEALWAIESLEQKLYGAGEHVQKGKNVRGS